MSSGNDNEITGEPTSKKTKTASCDDEPESNTEYPHGNEASGSSSDMVSVEENVGGSEKMSSQPPNSQEGSRHGKRHKKKGARFRRGRRGHRGAGFDYGTRGNWTPEGNWEYGWNQDQYGTSGWGPDLGYAGDQGRPFQRRSLLGFGPRPNIVADFSPDLKLRMAAEIQHQAKSNVDVKKVLKVMKIVEQMEGSEESESFSQERFTGNMSMMGQSAGMGMMGWGAGKETMGWGAGVGAMGRGAGMGRGTGMGMISQGAGMNMMGRGAGMNMMGRGMMGRQPFREGIPGMHRFEDSARPGMFDGQGHPRSLMNMDFPMPGKYMRSPDDGWNTGYRHNEPRSMFGRLLKFKNFLKKADLKRNPISVIDQAVDNCRFDLKKDYKIRPLRIGNRNMVTGGLFFGRVFLARSVGVNRKKVKNECYAKALHALTTQTVEAILKQRDPQGWELVQKYDEEVGLKIEGEEKAEAEDEIESETEESEEPENPDNPEVSEIERKIKRLTKHLKSLKQKITDCNKAVTFLNDAFTESGCGLESSYTEEETLSSSRIIWFIGNLKIDDILIGVGSGPSRKNAMGNTYLKALTFLRSNPVLTILKGVSVEDKDIVPGFEYVSERHSRLPNDSTEEKLANIISLVLDIPEGKSVRVEIDHAARRAGLVLTLLFKRGPSVRTRSVTLCEFYLDNIFITVGEGFKRGEAKNMAYQEALTVLSSSSSDVIFNDFKRLTREDLQRVTEVTELWESGQSKTLFSSNSAKVARAKSETLHWLEDEGLETIPDKNDMIIMEDSKWSGDRLNKAYDILQSSANRNLIVLQGKTTQTNGNFKCELFLQHEKAAEASHHNSSVSSTLAAAEFLFKQYHTKPAIKINYAGTDHINWISYETVKTKADKLKEESGDTESDDYIYIPAARKKKDEDKDEEAVEVDEEKETEEKDCESPSSTVPVNKWVKQITEDILEKFSKTETLEEIIFCGGFPIGEMMQIRQTAKKYKLMTRRKDHVKGDYSVIYQEHRLHKIVEILEKNGGKSGRYSIIPKESLPTEEKYKRWTDLFFKFL